MKIGTKILSGGLALSATSALAMTPVYVETQTGCTFDNQACKTLLYVNTSIKINDRYTFTPETLSTLNYKAGGKSDFNIAHGYVRFVINDKAVAKLGDWKFGMIYRYTAPTTESAQNAYSLGGLLFRPYASNSWKLGSAKLNFLARENFSFNMIKKPYPRNWAPTDSKGNPRGGNSPFTNYLEILPSLDITDNFSVSMNQTFAHSYQLASPAKKASWTTNHYQSYEVSYSHPKYTADTTVGLGLENSSDFGDSYKFMSQATTNWYLLIGRSF
jgi:hypothetical protein